MNAFNATSVMLAMFISLTVAFTAEAQITTVHPFPEGEFTAEEAALMVEIETLVVEINRLSGLSGSSAGYVSPTSGVTLYRPEWELPSTNPAANRLGNVVGRDVTTVLALGRFGTDLVYIYDIPPASETSKQCVIRFADDFWGLSSGAERDSRVAHELYHCFVLRHGRDFNLGLDYWFFEGAPQMVGDHFGDVSIAPPFSANRGSLSPLGTDYATQYMTSKTGLFWRNYDGAGYFNHLVEATSIGDVLRRLQDLFAYKSVPSNRGETESQTLLRLTIPEVEDPESIEATWVTSLWMDREPFTDGPEDWDYDYLDFRVPRYPTRTVDYVMDRGTVMHEIDLAPAEPEVVELVVEPGQYYRVTVENARARSLARNDDGLETEHRYEEEPFTFCVGSDCECPAGARAYDFEILEEGEEEEPSVVIAAVATEAGEGSAQIIYGKLTIERVVPPPCCTGGLNPREGFPDVTGSWQLRPGRLQAWADRIRDSRVEVIEEDPDTTCSPATVDDGSTVNITDQGSFRASFGATVEFECEDVGSSGTSTRTFTYGWRGHYSGCITLQEADGLRVGYPSMANPVTRRGVEMSQDFQVMIYNDSLDSDEQPVSVIPYQPSATANAYWYNVTSYLDYDQVTVREDARETITDTVDACVITETGVSCEAGVPRILGAYDFFATNEAVTPFDVFGAGETASGLFVPVPYYFAEFAGGPVEYPQIIR